MNPAGHEAIQLGVKHQENSRGAIFANVLNDNTAINIVN
jgi:hypothetical protein